MVIRSNGFRSVLLACLVLLVSLVGFSSNAFADSSLLKSAGAISADAMAQYDDFEIEAAETKILSAVKLIEENKISEPAVANIYVAQAVISYNRWKDSALTIAEDRAYNAFLKAVAINSEVTIPGDYRSNELDIMLERAKADLSAGSVPAAAVIAGPTFEHDAVITANRCSQLEITTKASNAAQIHHVALYYASDDNKLFAPVDMIEDANEKGLYRASIPGSATRGNQVRYYIEAANADGEHVGAVGSNFRPYSTTLSGSCDGLTKDDLSVVYGDPLFQFSLRPGTGVGIVLGGVEVQRGSLIAPPRPEKKYGSIKETGTGFTPLFLRVDGVFNLPANIQLGVYARVQFIDFLGKDDRYIYEGHSRVFPNLMIGGVFRYLAIARQPYRLYLGFDIGWGGASTQVRMQDGKTNIFLYEGQVHVAPQIGFLWTINKNVGLMVDLDVPIHFHKQVSAHFDFSVGPFFQF